MTSLFKFQAMEYLVRFVVGDWSRLAHGTWKFNIDRTEVKYDVLLKENETYDALVEMVRGKCRYSLLSMSPWPMTSRRGWRSHETTPHRLWTYLKTGMWSSSWQWGWTLLIWRCACLSVTRMLVASGQCVERSSDWQKTGQM